MADASSSTAVEPPRPLLGDRSRRVLWVAIAGLTVLVVLSLAVFPVRQYLDQRARTADRAQTLIGLQRENARLQARVDALNTPEEIQRIAREDYSLVFPGEETYAVLPPKRSTGPSVPGAWPFGD